MRSECETERFRLFEAVGERLSTATAVTPMVLVLDDVQWATPETLQLVRHIAQSTSPMPLLVLCAARDSATDMALLPSDPVALLQVAIDKLTRIRSPDSTASRPWPSSKGRRPRPGEDGELLAGLVHRQTGGDGSSSRTPFHLVETGALGQIDGRWQLVVPFESIGIPDGVRTTVTDRLGRLSESARRTLVLASVIGQRFDVGLVEDVSDPAGTDLLGTLEECVAAGLLEEVDVDRFQFRAPS